MKLSLLIIPCLILFSCKGNSQENTGTSADSVIADEAYQITQLPIMLEELSEEQRAIIREAHKTDTSSYLADTRPILFQIQGYGSNADETRNTHRINQSLDLMVYSLCEAKGEELLDYGWIENADTDKIIWKMKYTDTEFGGGDKRNRKMFKPLHLEPGTYRLRWKSNESHAVDDWIGDPPEREFYYGITVFNTQAIERYGFD